MYLLKNILYVDTVTKFVGGAEMSLYYSIINLDKTRYQSFLLTSGPGTFLDKMHAANIKAWSQDFPWLSRRHPWIYWKSIITLSKSIRHHNIDIIHTNCVHGLRYVKWASSLTGIPYISHVRDFLRPWFQGPNLTALKRAIRVIVNSRSVANTCREAGIDPHKIQVVYNPIDISAFKQITPDIKRSQREYFSIPPNSLVIGIVGNIQPNKGQLEFIQAGLKLAEVFSDTHFLIVGETVGDGGITYFEKLQNLITHSPFASRFHFVGFQSDIPAVMSVIDILAVPSSKEPFGRVAVEGLAAGCAVVASNTGGLPEIITDKWNGILVPPNDPEKLFQSTHKLADDTIYRKILINNGFDSVERFDIAHHVEQMQTLYDTVLEQN